MITIDEKLLDKVTGNILGTVDTYFHEPERIRHHSSFEAVRSVRVGR